jgi:hypothetical protein
VSRRGGGGEGEGEAGRSDRSRLPVMLLVLVIDWPRLPLRLVSLQTTHANTQQITGPTSGK